MKPYGFGTEKLEQELNALFPKARIARMDADSARRKGAASQILKRFARHETDILVGTQMITKGYDFPNVTLVGVISADMSLGFPDFRAGERTFQVLTQVAGRAGRGYSPGEVIIQTYVPHHYTIISAINHDYKEFYKKEIALRRELFLPPFSHIIYLTLRSYKEERAKKAAEDLARHILKKRPSGLTELAGPVQ